MRFSVFLSLLPFFIRPVASELHWEKKHLKFQPKIEDTKVVAEFSFSNLTNKPVTVKQIRTICNCTVADLAKYTYQPGESGKIIVTFEFGKRQGLQKKPIFITTDNEEKETALIIEADIPKVAEVRPLAVWWKKGNKDPKSVRFKTLSETPIRVTGIKVMGKEVQGKIMTIKEGREYEILITPVDTSKKLSLPIDIETDFPVKSRSVFRIYVIVP